MRLQNANRQGIDEYVQIRVFNKAFLGLISEYDSRPGSQEATAHIT